MNKYSKYLVTPTPRDTAMNMSKPPVPTQRTMKKDPPKVDEGQAFSNYLYATNTRASVPASEVEEGMKRKHPTGEQWRGLLGIHELLKEIL